MTTKIQDSLELLDNHQRSSLQDALAFVDVALPKKLKALRVQVVRGANGGCRLHIVVDFADPSPIICSGISSGLTFAEALASLRTLALAWQL